MRLLIDTHPTIWYVDQDHLLTSRAHAAISDPNNVLILSAASVWEIAVKVGIQKLTLSLPYRQWMAKAITDLSLTILPITVDYADTQASLPWHHRDPFDRLVISQSRIEGIPVISGDPQFDAYGITRIW
jgi:PIN domain nuclease of toxin-antitoxin system